MPRNYIRKRAVRWTEDDMKKALSVVKDGKMTSYAAAKQYNIPRETFRRYLNSNSDTRVKSGRPTVLTTNEEEEITQAIMLMVEWGYGIGRSEVTALVQSYCKAEKRKNPFCDGVPGYDWWCGFRKRHPCLTERTPQALQIHRAKAATPEKINHWFNQTLYPVLKQLGLEDHPHQIFNVDESGFPLAGRPGKILAPRGMKSPQSLIIMWIRKGKHYSPMLCFCFWAVHSSIHNIYWSQTRV